MHSVTESSPAADLQPESPRLLGEDPNIGLAAEALLACDARGADAPTMLAMCERLLAVTERQMLQREDRMMAAGDPNLATQVRRHGDVLFALNQQVRALRRGPAPLPRPFVQFISSLAEKFRATRNVAA